MTQARETSREKLATLRAALIDQGAQRAKLKERLDQCATHWNGRFECRSPACPHCRRRHVAREQVVMRRMFDGADNGNLAFVSVVLSGTRTVADIRGIMAQGKEATRKRIAACRASSQRWNGLCMSGWHEIDAISSDQFQFLPPQRRELLGHLAPVGWDQIGPTWLPTYHSICYLDGLPVQEVEEKLRKQWPLDGQVDVRSFDPAKSVDQNIDDVTSYANKFACETNLSADVIGGKIVEPWPVEWQANFFTWLQHAQRNPFEFLRFSVPPKAERLLNVSTEGIEAHSSDVEPMPFMHSVARLSTYESAGDWRDQFRL